MAWTIELLTSAAKQFRNLDPPLQKRILQYLHERVAKTPVITANPLAATKPVESASGSATIG